MRNKVTITIGTDGATDYVKTPDGRKHNLGSMSVLNIVAGLAENSTIAKKTLGTFLREKEVMMSANLDALWGMLPKHVVRFYSSNSLMSQSDRRDKTMNGVSEAMQLNSEQAKLIIGKLATANTKIDTLKSEDSGFDASSAKQHLLKIANKLETLISDSDFAESKIGKDLSDLNQQADTVCAVFKV